MQEIQIDKKGKITEGDNKGWFVRIESNRKDDSCLILISKDSEFKGEGYDSWVENKSMLPLYFKESGWVVEWLKD
jgi:hypothetical protein